MVMRVVKTMYSWLALTCTMWTINFINVEDLIVKKVVEYLGHAFREVGIQNVLNVLYVGYHNRSPST